MGCHVDIQHRFASKVLSFMSPHGLFFEVAAVNCLSLGTLSKWYVGHSDFVALTCMKIVLQAVHSGASTAP